MTKERYWRQGAPPRPSSAPRAPSTPTAPPIPPPLPLRASPSAHAVAQGSIAEREKRRGSLIAERENDARRKDRHPDAGRWPHEPGPGPPSRLPTPHPAPHGRPMPNARFATHLPSRLHWPAEPLVHEPPCILLYSYIIHVIILCTYGLVGSAVHELEPPVSLAHERLGLCRTTVRRPMRLSRGWARQGEGIITYTIHIFI